MRYMNVETISYTDKNGISYAIKDMREYPSYTTLGTYNLSEGDEIDEIASRTEIYGRDAEPEYYKIADHNRVQLFNAQFDLTKLKTLRIPNP